MKPAEYPIIRYKNGEKIMITDKVLREHRFFIKDETGYRADFLTIPGNDKELIEGFLISSSNRSLSSYRKTDGGYLIKTAPRSNSGVVKHSWDEESVLYHMNYLLHYSVNFKETGNIHTAMLVSGDKHFIGEDIGRHNAIDRAMGKAAKNGADFSSSVLYTTGRMPTDIVEKCIAPGVPTLVSRSAPTVESIKLAAKNRIDLIGFAGNNRMNIYKDFR